MQKGYVSRIIKRVKELGYENEEYILDLILKSLWNVAVTLPKIKNSNFYKTLLDNPFYPEFKEVYKRIEENKIKEAEKKLQEIYARLRKGGIELGLVNPKKWPETLPEINGLFSS